MWQCHCHSRTNRQDRRTNACLFSAKLLQTLALPTYPLCLNHWTRELQETLANADRVVDISNPSPPVWQVASMPWLARRLQMLVFTWGGQLPGWAWNFFDNLTWKPDVQQCITLQPVRHACILYSSVFSAVSVPGAEVEAPG